MREQAWSLGTVAIKAQRASFVKLPTALQDKIPKNFRGFCALLGNLFGAWHGHEKKIAVIGHVSNGSHEFLILNE